MRVFLFPGGDKKKLEQHRKIVMRLSRIPGFQSRFERGFVERAKRGTVDVEDLSQEIIEEMGVADPAAVLEAQTAAGGA